jgi:RNA polymerase sigma-70 factor (ECF subfamily)
MKLVIDNTQLTTGGIDDVELMSRLAHGEMECLGTLVRRHQHRVRCLAFRYTGRWDVADDIAQEAFLRVYRSAANYHPSAAFSTWLYRVVVNLCLDWGKRPRIAPLKEIDPPLDAGPDRGMLQLEKQQAIAGAIASLPERQRMAVLLHRFEGLSHSEVAQSTGWSESAVESLLTRAYAALRATLAEWDEG